MAVGQPDKSNVERLVVWNTFRENRFLQSIGLAYLPLCAVAVYGVVEPLLRNANEHLDSLLLVLALS